VQEYKGITRKDNADWLGWVYIDTYSPITDDFENDAPLNALVKKHYFTKRLYVILFNAIPYIIGLLIFLAKG